jgi:tRNA(fMet)-specific endonuclease VapC
MIFLPDTNVWIRFLNPGHDALKQKLLAVPPLNMRFCSVVKAELFYGAMKSRQVKRNLALLDDLFANISSFSFDDESARQYGTIRSALAHAGTPIGPNDLMIAAIALVHDAVLVTHNTREFSRVPGMSLQDWESEESPL